MLSKEGRPNLEMQIWIQQHLASHFPICKDAMESFGLMHRLDAQTSGVLLCAKSYTAACWIWTQWDSHDVTKEYVALVHGCVDPCVKEICKRVRVDCNVVGNFGNKIYFNGTVSDSGKPAYTEVATLAHLSRAASQRGNARNDAGEER